MNDLPEPLTPPDCDLRGFEWMPLLKGRLFLSGWYRAARRDARGGIAALKLWCEAWEQVPAGSLPNDEDELCMLADIEDQRAWQKHRKVAMRGFILCSDNRWYHPVVAEQAIKAYDCRLRKQRDVARTEEERRQSAERMRRLRAKGKDPDPPPNGHDIDTDVTRNIDQCDASRAPNKPPDYASRYGPKDALLPSQPALVTRHVTVARASLTEETVRTKEERKESKELVNNSNIIPMSRARARPASAAQQIGTQNQIGRVSRALATTADHASGKRPLRTRDQQIAATADPPKPKAIHLSPEQLKVVRKRATI